MKQSETYYDLELDAPVRRLRASDVLCLQKAGLIDLSRYELLDGKLREKTVQSNAHGDVVMLAVEWLAGIFGMRHLQTQRQIDIAEFDPFNNPEPDVAVLAQPRTEYYGKKIVPERDVLLAVEVSVSTRPKDAGYKMRLYAEYGVPEYWILDVRARTLTVYRDPQGVIYTNVVVYRDIDSVAPLAGDGAVIVVSDVLPPPGAPLN